RRKCQTFPVIGAPTPTPTEAIAARQGKHANNNEKIFRGNPGRVTMRHQRILIAGALAASIAASSAHAQDKQFNLKLSYWVPPSHFLTPGYKDWAAEVEKASGGTIKVTL